MVFGPCLAWCAGQSETRALICSSAHRAVGLEPGRENSSCSPAGWPPRAGASPGISRPGRGPRRPCALTRFRAGLGPSTWRWNREGSARGLPKPRSRSRFSESRRASGSSRPRPASGERLAPGTVVGEHGAPSRFGAWIWASRTDLDSPSFFEPRFFSHRPLWTGGRARGPRRGGTTSALPPHPYPGPDEPRSGGARRSNCRWPP